MEKSQGYYDSKNPGILWHGISWKIIVGRSTSEPAVSGVLSGYYDTKNRGILWYEISRKIIVGRSTSEPAVSSILLGKFSFRILCDKTGTFDKPEIDIFPFNFTNRNSKFFDSYNWTFLLFHFCKPKFDKIFLAFLFQIVTIRNFSVFADWNFGFTKISNWRNACFHKSKLKIFRRQSELNIIFRFFKNFFFGKSWLDKICSPFFK